MGLEGAVKPYFQDESVTIYHGDCREILPQLGPADVILTDPPWPLKKEIMAGTLNAVALWTEVAPLLKAKRLVVWLGIQNDPRDFLNPLKEWPYLRGVYIRRAIPGYFGRLLIDGEMLYVLGEWPVARKGRMVIPGGIQITYVASDRDNGHPGPRSLIATRWLLEWWSDEGDTILDPFMGSGTTLRAAKDLCRKAIGIEIEERYCEIAAKRMSQSVMDLAVDTGSHGE